MKIREELNEAQTEVWLEGEGTYESALAFKAVAERALARGKALWLNCEGLKSLDVAWLQVLLAAERSLMNAGRTFALLSVQPQVATWLSQVGASRISGAIVSVNF